MHEYSLIQSLVARVEEEVLRRGAVAVHALSVRVGELSGVDPDLLRTAYETFRAGTVCEKATLALSTVPASWSCPRCRSRLPRGAVLRCPGCDLPAELEAGSDALFLDRIEMEVP